MATSTLGNLAVNLIGDKSQLEQTLNTAQEKTKGLASNMQNMGKRVSKAGGTMTKWVSGPLAGAATAITGLVGKTANWADELLDLQEVTGMSTDTLQEWRHVANEAGTDQDAVADGTARLRRQYDDLAEGQGTAIEGFKNLGISVRDSNGDMKDMETLTDEAMSELADMEDQTERNAAAQNIFGGATEDILPILADSSEELEKMREEANVVDEEDLNALDEFRQMWDRLKKLFMDTFREVATNLLPLFQDTLMPLIQEKLMPAIEDFGERIGALIEWFTDLDPRIQKMAIGFVALLAALGPILLVVGKIITVFGTITGVLAGVSAALLWKVAVVAAVVAAIMHLWRTNEEFREVIMEVWDQVREFMSETWERLKEIFELGMEFIKEVIDVALEIIESMWDTWGENILEMLKTIWDQIELVIDTVINTIKDIIGFALAVIRGDWDEAWDRILSILENVWELIEETITNALDIVKEIINGALTAIDDTFGETFRNIKGFLSDTWDDILGRLGSFKDGFVEVFESIRDGIKVPINAMLGFLDTLLRGIESMVNNMAGAINDLPSFDIPNWLPDWAGGGGSFGFPNIGEISLPDIPTLHSGTQHFKPPDGKREGLALLERGEQVIAQGDRTTGGESVNFARMFEGANFYVRSDQDIKEVAKELHRHMKSAARGQGVQL